MQIENIIALVMNKKKWLRGCLDEMRAQQPATGFDLQFSRDDASFCWRWFSSMSTDSGNFFLSYFLKRR